MRKTLSTVRPSALTCWVAAFGLLYAGGCSNDPEAVGDGDGNGNGDGDADTAATTGGSDGGDGDVAIGVPGDGDTTGAGGTSGGLVCETTSSGTALAPIFLAFAFDVSGSMGKLDRPNWWHDPTAKWAPVVAATAAFFSDAEGTDMSASMALFPAGDDSCDSTSYGAPDVAMTTLPSVAFQDAFTAYETEVGDPLAGGDWRGGTPTLAAFLGTAEYLETFRATSPEAKFAIVLVTDGLPQGCDDTSGIAPVVEAVNSHFLATGVPTYVVGIENPTIAPTVLPAGWADWGDDCAGTPCAPPATLTALNEVAVAGQSESAFLIDTGDPVATKTAFRAAIEAIRGQAISCDLAIPANPVSGVPFDKDKINVALTVDLTTTAFSYDPDCLAPNSWRYNDPVSAEYIELCPATCDYVKSLPNADLQVDFLCEPREEIEE